MQTKEEISDDDELLTAYLDGELSENEMNQLRQRLVREDSLRARLAHFQAAWDLLDELPETPVNPMFTKSTLEMVTMRANVAASTTSLTHMQFGRLRTSPWLLWSGLTIAAISLGLLLGWIYRVQDERKKLLELQLWADVPTLKFIDSIEMARRLTTIPEWEILADEIYVEDIIPPQPLEIRAKRAWVDSLKASQQAKLQVSQTNFENLDPDKRARLLTISRQIGQQEDAEYIRRALRAVHALIDDEERPDIFRTDLIQLEKNRDHDAIFKRILEEACDELGSWYADNMSEPDREAIINWITPIADAYRLENPDDYFSFLRYSGQQSDPVQFFLFNVYRSGRQSDRKISYFSSTDIESLMQNLSARAVNILAPSSDVNRNRDVERWIRKAVSGDSLPSGRINDTIRFMTFSSPNLRDRTAIELAIPRDAQEKLNDQSRRNRGGGRGRGPNPPGNRGGPPTDRGGSGNSQAQGASPPAVK